MSRLTWALVVGALVVGILYGYRLAVMRAEVRDAHDRVVEVGCTHRVFEDGSVVHLDAEVAHECLRRQLGWP